MKATIKEIHSTRKWSWGKWDVFYFDITLSDWVRWSIGKQKEDAFKVWDEINYETEVKDWKTKIKEIKDKQAYLWWAKKDYPKDAVSFAMSYAKDLVVSGKIELNNLITQADIIYDRMKKKYW